MTRGDKLTRQLRQFRVLAADCSPPAPHEDRNEGLQTLDYRLIAAIEAAKDARAYITNHTKNFEPLP